MCRRVLRSKIDCEIAERSFGHVGLFRFAATETPGTFTGSAKRRSVTLLCPARGPLSALCLASEGEVNALARQTLVSRMACDRRHKSFHLDKHCDARSAGMRMGPGGSRVVAACNPP